MTLAGFLIIALAILALIFRNSLKIQPETLAKIFFSIFILSAAAYIATMFIGDNGIPGLFGSLWMYAAFAFVLVHTLPWLGYNGTVIFFSISLLSGFLSEYLGTAYGWVYGSYYYHSIPPFFFGLVPLATPISWAIIIYMCFTLTNIFYWGFGGKDINTHGKHTLLTFGLLLLLSFIDGLIAINLDMIIDPVAVSPQIGGWVWTGGGAYFGVPISNYIGWFFVTFFSTILFRGYQNFSRKGLSGAKPFNPIYVVALYLVYFVINACLAVSIGHIEYALIGAATMMPFCLLSMLWLYIRIMNNVEEKPVKGHGPE